MGAIQDLLQEVPLSAVLKERVALAEQKYERAMRENADLKQRIQTLEEENAGLRTQIPQQERAESLDAIPCGFSCTFSGPRGMIAMSG